MDNSNNSQENINIIQNDDTDTEEELNIIQSEHEDCEHEDCEHEDCEHSSNQEDQEDVVVEGNNDDLHYYTQILTPLFLGSSNNQPTNLLNNLNNLYSLLNFPTTIMNVTPTNTIVSEINPSNSGNSVLPQTTLAGLPNLVFNGISIGHVNNNNPVTQQMIDEETTKLIIEGNNYMHMVEQPLLDFINMCYLENIQYDEDLIDLVRYTIRTSINRGSQYDIKQIIGGIMYYSLMGINVVFSDNYDTMVLPMLQNEIKRIVTQSLHLAILRRAIAPQMEDVKLVIKEEVLEKIPTMKYLKLEQKIKNMNSKCTVCQDDFNEQDNVRVLPCEHIYHLDCIDDWLKIHSYKCPCCRKPAAEYSPKI